jgi:pimeloyl-ACP methyl ester carboxylesterase
MANLSLVLTAQHQGECRLAKIAYRPRGGGFEALLTTGEFELVVRGTGLDDSDPALAGSPELKGNVALVALLLGYAANELACRRSRSPEKRASHRKEADRKRKDLLALSDLVARLDDRTTTAWCSGCFTKAIRRHVRGADRPRGTYLCQACGTSTVECAVPGCQHHALVTPSARVTLCYCAEHHHQIPSFDKLDANIPTIAHYRDFLKHEARNADRITKVAGGTVGAAAVIAPMALLAAPAIGAALGSSVLGGSLTGAAATSHGLAMLGGGAVASGGLGMVGGTAVVTATGTALGGALGATTATAYTGADPSFAIEQMRVGEGTPVTFATGFLTQGRSAWSEWQRLIDTQYPTAPVYQVHWGAKELKDLTAVLATSGSKAAVRAVLLQAAKRGSKGHGLPGIGWVLGAHGVATNPWTLARTRAGMTGATLAALIARTIEGPYVLMGHSLGARVMVTAAQALATRRGARRIESMHLMGAAVGSRGDWRGLAGSTAETIWNYWSSHDTVLRWLYALAEMGESAAGQTGFATRIPGIKNRNVSRLVTSHSDYVSKLVLSR